MFITFLFLLFITIPFLLYFEALHHGRLSRYRNAYTNKHKKGIIIDFFRISSLIVISIYSFSIHIYVFFALLFLTLTHVYQVYQLIKNKSKEEVLYEWNYSVDDVINWEDKYNRLKSNLSSTNLVKRIVITNHAIYFSEKKSISLVPRTYDILTLDSVSFENDFLMLKYRFATITLRHVYIYVPKKKRKETYQLINQITQK